MSLSCTKLPRFRFRIGYPGHNIFMLIKAWKGLLVYTLKINGKLVLNKYYTLHAVLSFPYFHIANTQSGNNSHICTTPMQHAWYGPLVFLKDLFSSTLVTRK